MTTVVAAVIERDGRILIAQRKRTRQHPLKWEFPGGKVEPAETPENAVVRELEEELGIRAQVGPEIGRYEFQYEGRWPIMLMFYRVVEFSGEPIMIFSKATRSFFASTQPLSAVAAAGNPRCARRSNAARDRDPPGLYSVG
jgi:mutator protein MutT